MDKRFLLGILEMDQQHEQIFALVERARKVESDELEISSIVTELLNYAGTHLDHEEKFLNEKGLKSFLVDHAKKHQRFRVQAMEFYHEYRAASDLITKVKILSKIIEFCENWLVVHIEVEDRMYADLLNKKNK